MSASPAPLAVELSGVEHRYRAVTALENVSLALPAGCMTGFIGPDGVGKSTLLGLIAGIRRVQRGTVRVLGTDITRRREREALLPRLAYMPQGLGGNLYPSLSVHENVDFFGRLFGLGARARGLRIRRLLEATGLAPFADRPCGKLSGGMKQKLGLCCSLVHDPELLILDEPTTGVDPLSRRQFWTLIEALRRERARMTVIVATAYMEEAQRFEHLVALSAGRVLISDSLPGVLARTGTSTLEEAYVALLPAARQSGAGFARVPYVNPGGEPAIEAAGLTRRFGDFTAVDHVSFKIGRGEIFGFLGSNGSGKTTTMKMLTGLLAASSGSARLLGRAVDPHDLATRLKVGYMSQSFSLYQELTVRQNLTLHARLYQIDARRAPQVVDGSLAAFELEAHAAAMPGSLPLGIRQRLQLAAACLHQPEVLLLDEPTSGVDPAARDMFWRHLIALSREQHVTLFVSTHFMNEAERCDRVSLMDRGRVLAVGSPAELMQQRGAASLEEAFIGFLENLQPAVTAGPRPALGREGRGRPEDERPETEETRQRDGRCAAWARVWAFARREGTELARDRMRIGFALLGPIALLCIAAYSISFDIEHVRFAVLDEDHSFASRELATHFWGSRYFTERPAPASAAAAEGMLRSGEAQLIIDIPPGFERDLLTGREPEVGMLIDGSEPFTAANVRAYATGAVLEYVSDLERALPAAAAAALAFPVTVEPRFIYNQEFRSIYAITPGVIMLTLILIPAMLTALGVVREKETGSITNLYASPSTIGEYLLGKQLPYVGIALVSYLILVALTVLMIGVPLKGSFLALSFGALLFTLAGTSLGLLISTLVGSQVAAIFGTAILCLIPSVNFSGLLYPVSTLTGSGYLIARFFPSSWFQLISLGAFTKGLDARSFLPMYAALAALAGLYLLGARLLLKKQAA